MGGSGWGDCCSVECHFLALCDFREAGLWDCWRWRGPLGAEGAGLVLLDGRMQQAPRVAFLLFTGPLREDQVVRHTCGNLACVRPDHLVARLVDDDDADERGRTRAHSTARLNERQVIQMRQRRAGGTPTAVLARQFGISRNTVWRVVSGQSWSHVGGPLA